MIQTYALAQLPAARQRIHKGVNEIETLPRYGEPGLEESVFDDSHISGASMAFICSVVVPITMVRLSAGALPTGYPIICCSAGIME